MAASAVSSAAMETSTAVEAPTKARLPASGEASRDSSMVKAAECTGNDFFFHEGMVFAFTFQPLSSEIAGIFKRFPGFLAKPTAVISICKKRKHRPKKLKFNWL